MATLKLVLGDLELDLNDPDTTGLTVDTVDLGAPTVREVVTDLPGQDGQFDDTAYFGPRSISISGTAMGDGTVGSKQKALDALAPFLSPRVRPSLVYSIDSDVDERELTVRVAQWSNPFANPGSAAFQLQFKAVDPIAMGLDTNEVDIPPFTGASEGRIYPRSYDRTYPVSFGGIGQAFVDTNGNYDAWPTFRIFGPANFDAGATAGIRWLDPDTADPLGTQIILGNDSAGTLEILTGDYLEIDTKAHTVLLNGDSDASRYSFVDFSATSWGPLIAGRNLLKFVVSDASSPAVAEVLWRDAYL